MEIVLGISAVLATFLGIWITYRQNRPAETLALRDLHRTPSFSLGFNRTDADQIVWVLPWEKYKRTYLLEFELSLHNTGDDDLEEVYLIVEIPSDIYGPELPRSFKKDLRIVSVERFVDPIEGKEFSRITYRFESIQPNVQILVSDFIWFHNSSRLLNTLKATCRDGVDVEVAYQLLYGFGINLMVVARNVLPYRRHVSILSFDHSDSILENLKHPETVLWKAIGSKDEWDKGKSARLFFVETPDLEPKEFPPEIRSRIAKVRLKGIPNQMATHHPSLGYIPFGKPVRSRRRGSSLLAKMTRGRPS